MATNDILEYKVDHDHRGPLYIINNFNNDIKEGVNNLQKSFRYLGFRIPRTRGTLNINSLKIELENEINFINDDCLCAIYLSPQSTMFLDISGELDFLKLFHSNRNHNFQNKPRIIFLIYEISKAYSQVQSDSIPAPIPVEADILVFRIETINVKATLGKLSAIIESINQEIPIATLYHMLRKEIPMSIFQTLTKRFRLGRKDEKKLDRKKHHNAKRNRLLKLYIEQVLDVDGIEDDTQVQNFIRVNKLNSVLGRLKMDIYATIPNQERLIAELEYFNRNEDLGYWRQILGYFTIERIILISVIIYIVFTSMFYEK